MLAPVASALSELSASAVGTVEAHSPDVFASIEEQQAPSGIVGGRVSSTRFSSIEEPGSKCWPAKSEHHDKGTAGTDAHADVGGRCKYNHERSCRNAVIHIHMGHFLSTSATLFHFRDWKIQPL